MRLRYWDNDKLIPILVLLIRNGSSIHSAPNETSISWQWLSAKISMLFINQSEINYIMILKSKQTIIAWNYWWESVPESGPGIPNLTLAYSFLTQKWTDFGVLFIGNGQGTEPTEFASIILVINPISNPFLIRLLGDFSNEQSLSNLSWQGLH